MLRNVLEDEKFRVHADEDTHFEMYSRVIQSSYKPSQATVSQVVFVKKMMISYMITARLLSVRRQQYLASDLSLLPRLRFHILRLLSS